MVAGGNPPAARTEQWGITGGFRMLRPVCLLILLLAGTAPMAASAPPREDEAPDHFKVPETTAGRLMKYVLRSLNAGKFEKPEEQFTDDFLEDVTPKELDDAAADIERTLEGRVYATGVIGEDRDDALTVSITGSETDLVLSAMLLVDDRSKKITGLRFAPLGGGQEGDGGAQAEDEAGDWDALADTVNDLPGEVAFAAYELKDVPKGEGDDGPQRVEMLVVAAHNEHRTQAIGSTFKLYVLGALAGEILGGRAAWDEKLAIRDEWKSLPSGRMQLMNAGSEFALLDYARPMIAISDNTAADHLIHRVGRDRVEAYTNAINDNTVRNTPFLTTREMFALKLFPDASVTDKYVDSTDAEQRAMLAPTGPVAAYLPALADAADWEDPIAIDSLEWFASPRQCCRAMANLREFERRPAAEHVADIIRRNAGLSFDPRVWKSVGFKGGSEPGVMNGTWLLERADGRWYTLCVGWNNAKETIDNKLFIEVATNAVKLLAKDLDPNAAPADDGVPPPKANPQRPDAAPPDQVELPSRRRT